MDGLPNLRIWHEGKLAITESMKLMHNGKEEKPIMMVSTQVNDPTGKEIFVGDVAERICLDKQCEPTHRGEVSYSKEAAQYVLISSDGHEYPMCLVVPGKFGTGNMYITPTVIGNKYENPELLK